MELLRAVVDINEKKVVEKKVLDEVIFIESFLVGHQKILDLERCQFAYHINIIAAAFCEQDVLKLVLIKHFKELITGNHLAVRRRIHKREYGAFILFRMLECGSQDLSLHITDAKVNSCNLFQSFDIRL